MKKTAPETSTDPLVEVRKFNPLTDDFESVAEGTEALPHQIERWPYELSSGAIDLIVAYKAKKPIGRAIVRWPNGHHPFPPVLEGLPTVQSVRVHEEYRCQGIGLQLMKTCEDILRARPEHSQKLALGVRVTNRNAQELYKFLGYRRKQNNGKDFTYYERLYEIGPDGKIQNFPALCYLMTKDLSAE